MRAVFLSILLLFLPSFCQGQCTAGPWSNCLLFDATATCGDGARERSYTSATGAICTPSVVVVSCTITCNNDCEVSDWSEWSVCNKFCATGQQFSVRHITRLPTGTGSACPTDLSKSQDCNDHECPKDCNVGDWTAWSSCHLPANDTVEVSCSDESKHGIQTRSREITHNVSNRPGGDETCPDNAQSRYCNAFPCKIDCAMSEWGDWSECTASCGTASRRRTKYIKHQSQNGGADCGPIEEVEKCDTYSCDLNDLIVDCEEKEKPQFLLLPDVCPTDVVYCPGNKAKGYVKSCPEGEAFNSRHWECVDEDDICEDGQLNDHHYYYGTYKYGYHHRQPRYYGFNPHRSIGFHQAHGPPYNPFSNYYPQPRYQPVPATSQSQGWIPPSLQGPSTQQENYFPPLQTGSQQQQDFYPPPGQQQQGYFPLPQPPQGGFPQNQDYYQQQQGGYELGKKFGGVPPSFLCPSDGEFRTGECNTYWKCHGRQQSQYRRCPGNQKFQETSPSSGHCDPSQYC